MTSLFEPMLLAGFALITTSLGYLAAWCRYSPRLKRIERQSWASAAKFYTAKSCE